jgi:hypothetical protein
MYLFLFIAVILVGIYYATSDTQKDGFSAYNGVNEGSSAALNIPPVPSMLAPVPSGATRSGATRSGATRSGATRSGATRSGESKSGESKNGETINVEPSNLPGPLPVAPYDQIGTMNPIPYQDTTLIKATKKQLESLFENLKSFMSFESQHLQEKSDPTVQLPLSSLQSDFQHVKNEMDVINRNPGLQPNITMTQLNEISANMEYLKRIIRISENASGPSSNAVTEGFVPGPRRRNVPLQSAVNPAQAMKGPVGGTGRNYPATLEDLVSFVGRIQGEILRFSASATSDPVVQARISGLTKMKNDVQDIINKLNSGAILPIEVQILKKDIDTALPILSKPSEPLPRLLKELNIPKGLANALPSNIQKDPDTMREISRVIDKYADTILNGVSASFNVKYVSEREENIERYKQGRKQGQNIKTGSNNPLGSSIDKTGFPSFSDLDNVSNAKFIPVSNEHPVTDRLAPIPMDAGRGPSHFDWKQRAKEIEQQIKLRKLNVKDFGIMPPNTNVSNGFSWKGYARMICTRLQATMDPALPETCGCPPMNWAGWRS